VFYTLLKVNKVLIFNFQFRVGLDCTKIFNDDCYFS
jgi:hypothetical protein